VTGGWRNLHNEKLCNLYPSPSIIKMIKLRRMRWAGHEACMNGEEKEHVYYWRESQKKKTSRKTGT
jgi:hypothetical protein